MRKGALTTGSIVCNSIPVDMRTTQLVPGTGLRFGEKVFGSSLWPPAHTKAVFRLGQPYWVLISVLNCTGLICNCEARRIGSTPASTKGAIATGPAMVIRYSRLPFMLRSPPGVTSCWYGTGIFQQLLTHAPEELVKTGNLGLAGTKVPSWFRRGTLCAQIGRASCRER